MTTVAELQEEKEIEIEMAKKYESAHSGNDSESIDRRQSEAARTLQRTYRGHRDRRQMEGLCLDPSTRWNDAVKEAQYRDLTTPRPSSSKAREDGTSSPTQFSSGSHQKWLRATKIVARANADDDDNSSSSSTGAGDEESAAQKEARRRKRTQHRQERAESARMMDLQYFLEMIDVKHRYGSSLRKYHMEWKKSTTHENFFYWLDYGGGKDISLEACSRERLDKEQVRYLGREERMDYLVMADGEGKLCWKKNGDRIDTTTESRDSIHGIVPVGDMTPMFAPVTAATSDSPQSDHSSSEDYSEAGSGIDGTRSNNKISIDKDTDAPQSPNRSKEVSPAALFDHLLKKSGGKKGGKKSQWIFVADTSYNLYVGMKQRGAFQHSSFLHGARISAAGLIKIKAGQLQSLQPRSGHYRPTASNFRAFIRNLEFSGVDMSAVNPSQSYAVLYGVGGYNHTKKIWKEMGEGLQKVIHPAEEKRKEEEKKDKSQSAEKERVVLKEQKGSKTDKLLKALSIGKTKEDGE